MGSFGSLKEALVEAGIIKDNDGTKTEKPQTVGSEFIDKAIVVAAKKETHMRKTAIKRYPGKFDMMKRMTHKDFQKENSGCTSSIILKERKMRRSMEQSRKTVTYLLIAIMRELASATKAQIVEEFRKRYKDKELKATDVTLKTFMSKYANAIPEFVSKGKNADGELLYIYTPRVNDPEADVDLAYKLYVEKMDKIVKAYPGIKKSESELAPKPNESVKRKIGAKVPTYIEKSEDPRTLKEEISISEKMDVIIKKFSELEKKVDALFDYTKGEIKKKLTEQELMILGL